MVKKSKSFTLIELLTVIFIIVILTTLIVANMSSSRRRARDAKRKADLKSLQTAIEMFYYKTGSYPKTPSGGAGVAGCWHKTCNWIPNNSTNDGSGAPCGGALYQTLGYEWAGSYLASEPHDPVDKCYWPFGNETNDVPGSAGSYQYWSDGKNYLLAARLENVNDPARNEITRVHAPQDSDLTRSYAEYYLAVNSTYTLGKYCYVLTN
ncbi:MAG: prepilin-type N-terminal cleavage/methylation domain-containing protein [Candidatus Berkelbacteria bacterium]|nr:prepilin-type N-terminal cleavage/methylation domain-containing protein [Candidatus Berkelbacteria bacterium]